MRSLGCAAAQGISLCELSLTALPQPEEVLNRWNRQAQQAAPVVGAVEASTLVEVVPEVKAAEAPAGVLKVDELHAMRHAGALWPLHASRQAQMLINACAQQGRSDVPHVPHVQG